MDEGIYTPKQLSQILGVNTETLRLWYQEGKIQGVTTKGGHHRYKYLIQDEKRKHLEGKRRLLTVNVFNTHYYCFLMFPFSLLITT